MLVQSIEQARQSAHVVVLGNEKGGSGKSTTALHIAVALLKAGQRVATIDLDSRQQSFTHYVENRRAWGRTRAHQARDADALLHGADREQFARSQQGAGIRQLLEGDQRDRTQ